MIGGLAERMVVDVTLVMDHHYGEKVIGDIPRLSGHLEVMAASLLVTLTVPVNVAGLRLGVVAVLPEGRTGMILAQLVAGNRLRIVVVVERRVAHHPMILTRNPTRRRELRSDALAVATEGHLRLVLMIRRMINDAGGGHRR